jgi:hypothetical protein
MSKIVPCNATDPVICQATSVENSAVVFEGHSLRQQRRTVIGRHQRPRPGHRADGRPTM